MIEEVVGFDSTRPVVLATKGSVGTSGNNYYEDIKLVQSMLNNVPPTAGGPANKLAVDASPGPLTIQAIKRFQAANGCVCDGRVDARGRTIRALIAAQIASQKPLPTFAGLRPATADDVAPARAGFDFPTRRPHHSPSDAVGAGGNAVGVRGNTVGAGGNSGFGAPFTRAGWTIDNSVGAFDISVSDTGFYSARMTIFRDADPTDNFTATMVGGFKSVSKGPPISADIALPSFTSTKGVIFRGLNGFTPISRPSFLGLCGFAFVGINPASAGASLNLFQFNWIPAGPPGMCMGFAFMAGVQGGIPGVSAGAGSALVIPV